MPNHCSQTLVVSGPVEVLKRFMEFAKENEEESEDGEFEVLSASKFIPYPKVFANREEFENWYQNEGYGWSLANWGTKWGIYWSGLSNENLSYEPGSLTYTFSSAWEPADKIVIAMAKQYPQLRFELTYEEIGMCFKGNLIMEDGEIVDENYQENCTFDDEEMDGNEDEDEE